MFEYVQWTCIRTFVNISLFPNRVKTYHSSRTNLFACRIFYPHDHNGKQIIPLVIRVHGGGFLLNNPAVDDPIARHLADRAQCVVISIDYSKAPQYKFPAAYEDVVEQILKIIDDPDLPLDRSRVILCGASAGGNLVLAAAQDPRLRAKIASVAAVYAVVDLVPKGKAKTATRPDPSVPDFMGGSYDGISGLLFDDANKPALTDVRISPTYFTSRDSLPPQVLLIGAEHDMFCHEAEAMADKLAGSERKADAEGGWQVPGVRWYKVRNEAHAFDQFQAKDPERERARSGAIDDMNSVIVDFLDEVLSPKTAKDVVPS
ncbi:hypothetical protein LTR22_000229 [Elasticomyces elasticus]|nr:hypothetical protein LTR22_000229 [Elasticomyces elasticus]KAK4930589.1 hypothetical protein LTR49_003003 [Elasticomyces elasticus]KAK5757908.1 hypothetical protein LTS12_011947 [Elasticomyces elasticus]